MDEKARQKIITEYFNIVAFLDPLGEVEVKDIDRGCEHFKANIEHIFKDILLIPRSELKELVKEWENHGIKERNLGRYLQITDCIDQLGQLIQKYGGNDEISESQFSKNET